MNSTTDRGAITYSIRLDDGTEMTDVYDGPFALPKNAKQLSAQWHYLDRHSNTTLLNVQ